MPLMTTTINTGLNAITAVCTHASLHTGDPSTTGANEVTGGSPAYARQPITWAAASGETAANSGALTFNVPAGTTAAYVGLWSALSAGTFHGWFPYAGSLQTPQMAVGADTGDTFTSYGHGFANGDRIAVYPKFGESLGGLTEGTLYFVINSATNTFQLSLTSGGAAVTITPDIEVWAHRGIPETFASQGTATVAIGDLILDGRVL